MWKCLLLGTLVLLLPLGCGERKLSPEEIEERQQVARAWMAQQLVELEAKDKKAPLDYPSRVVIDHGPVSHNPAVVHQGLEIFFNNGVPERVSSLQPKRYQEIFCDRSESVTLSPEESEELATLLAYFFSKQYAPVYWGGCFGPVRTFKVTWYDEGGAEYVRSSVPDSYGTERPDDALDTLVRSLQARCLTIPMLLESLRDEDLCMRNFALMHIEAGLRGDRSFLGGAEEAPAVLQRMLDDPDNSLRIIAAECLFMLFDERHVYCEQATDSMLEMLKTGDEGERRSAIGALDTPSLSRKNEVVDALLVALRDEYDGVRYAASGALRHFRHMPERAEDIVSGLRMALGDEDKNVRALAAGSLEALDQYPEFSEFIGSL